MLQATQILLFTYNPNIGPMASHLWHPTGWSVDCWRPQGPGWSRSGVQFAARLYPPHWWCGLAEEKNRKEKLSGNCTNKSPLHFKCLFREGGTEAEMQQTQKVSQKSSLKGEQSERHLHSFAQKVATATQRCLDARNIFKNVSLKSFSCCFS